MIDNERDELLVELLLNTFGECPPTFTEEDGTVIDNFEPHCFSCLAGRIIRFLRDDVIDDDWDE